MTWAELKAAVEKAGVKDDDDIAFIDVTAYEEIDVQWISDEWQVVSR